MWPTAIAARWAHHAGGADHGQETVRLIQSLAVGQRALGEAADPGARGAMESQRRRRGRAIISRRVAKRPANGGRPTSICHRSANLRNSRPGTSPRSSRRGFDRRSMRRGVFSHPTGSGPPLSDEALEQIVSFGRGSVLERAGCGSRGRGRSAAPALRAPRPPPSSAVIPAPFGWRWRRLVAAAAGGYRAA